MLIVEFRNDGIALLQGKASMNKCIVNKASVIPIDESYLSDGKIVDPIKTASLILDKMDDLNIKDKRCIVVIQDRFLRARILNVPKADQRRLNLIVRNEFLTTLNLTPDYLVDYRPLSTFHKDENDQLFRRVLATGMAESALDSFFDTLKALNLKCRIIDISTSGLINFVNWDNTLTVSRPILFVDVHASYARLHLFHDFEFTLFSAVNYPEPIETQLVRRILMLDEFVSTNFRKRLQNVYLYGGNSEIIGQVAERFAGTDIQCSVVPLHKKIVVPKDVAIIDYIEMLGMLVRK